MRIGFDDRKPTRARGEKQRIDVLDQGRKAETFQRRTAQKGAGLDPSEAGIRPKADTRKRATLTET
jgi:hypothetical protein